MDHEIQQHLHDDDPAALELIWNAYANDLLAYLTSALRSRSDAEDALQDLFVTIAKKRRALAAASKLKPYLFRMARNVAVNRIRRDSRRRQRQETAHDILSANQDNSKAPVAEVNHALAELPANQRTIITMKFFRNKTFREISELLGIPENTAGSRYRYGMNKLRNLLRQSLQ